MDTNFPATPESDQPMSIDMMREIKESGAATIGELALLLDRSESACYDYLIRTELKAGQIIRLFRLAKSDRVREIILKHLLPGSGFTAMKLPVAADLDGDGDVDTDDALAGASEVIAQANTVLRSVVKRRAEGKRVGYADARHTMQSAAEHALTSVSILDFLEANDSKRNKLNGHARGRGVARA